MRPNAQRAIVFVLGLLLAWGAWSIPGMPRMKNKGVTAVVVAAVFTGVYVYFVHDYLVTNKWISDTPTIFSTSG